MIESAWLKIEERFEREVRVRISFSCSKRVTKYEGFVGELTNGP